MKLSKCDCSRGAPMGRASVDLHTPALAIKLHLQYVPLDSGGYDAGGAYWGLRFPQPYTYPSGHKVMRPMRIYWFYHPAPNGEMLVQGFVDAWDRQDAKDQIRGQYPNATFYR